jgi:hypothetical protein
VKRFVTFTELWIPFMDDIARKAMGNLEFWKFQTGISSRSEFPSTNFKQAVSRSDLKTSYQMRRMKDSVKSSFMEIPFAAASASRWQPLGLQQQGPSF